MSSLNYANFVSIYSNILQVESTNADFLNMLPLAIDYATDRVVNDLDLIAWHGSGIVTLTPGTNSATIPTPTGSGNAPIYVVEEASVVTPASTAPSAGTLNPLQRVSKQYLSFVWGASATTGLPVCYAVQDATTMLFGPVPDAAYEVQVSGLFRPPVLSQTTTTTWITDNLPELFMAAACVFGFSWQRDVGAMADDQQATITWESNYSKLLQSDIVLEARRFARSTAWSALQPSPVANPPRP